MTVQYNQSQKGRVYSTTYGGAYYPSADGLFHDVVWVDGDSTLTGYYAQTAGGNVYWQTTAGYWIVNGDSSWKQLDTTRAVSTWSAADAQRLVNQIIENDAYIVANNLLCARYANKLTARERNTLYGLQSRLERRDAALRADGLLTNIQTSYPEGYAELGSYLEQFMQNPQGVSAVVSTTAIVVVSAIVVASLATAAYFAYKAFANESKDDVKYSKELTAVLQSRLTEEEYQQLLDETAGIVTKARIKQSISSNTTLIGLMLAGLGVLMVVNLWKGGSIRQ